ncbi:MAG: hypothetical protein ABWY96_03720 [Gaiellaceae bacterium]
MPGLPYKTLVPAVVAAAALVVASSAAASPVRSDARGSPAADAALTAPVVVLGVPPANDAIAAATVVGSLPFSEAINTLEATTAPDDPQCGSNEASVWYAFTPATTAWATADTFGSDYDTTLAAYTGAPGSLNEIACSDDAVGSQSRVSFLAEAGVTYYLLAAGWFGGGNLVLSVDASGPFEKLPVKATGALEATPAAAPGWFAWARAPRGARFWSLMVQGPEGTVKANRSRTHGFSGGFVDDTFVYQEIRGRQSSLQFFDPMVGNRWSPPTGVNTRHWEWHPTISGDWLLFGRAKAGTRTDSIVLKNVSTGETILLDRRPWGSHRIAEPGQVAGNYAVWYRCTPRCDVFLYDIALGTKTRIPNPQGKQQYDPSVTSDGTVYFVRSGRGCGAAVRLVRAPLGGPETVLTSLGTGRDSFHTFALEHSQGVSLYFESVRCSNRATDVLRIIDP